MSLPALAAACYLGQTQTWGLPQSLILPLRDHGWPLFLRTWALAQDWHYIPDLRRQCSWVAVSLLALPPSQAEKDRQALLILQYILSLDSYISCHHSAKFSSLALLPSLLSLLIPLQSSCVGPFTEQTSFIPQLSGSLSECCLLYPTPFPDTSLISWPTLLVRGCVSFLSLWDGLMDTLCPHLYPARMFPNPLRPDDGLREAVTSMSVHAFSLISHRAPCPLAPVCEACFIVPSLFPWSLGVCCSHLPLLFSLVRFQLLCPLLRESSVIPSCSNHLSPRTFKDMTFE